MIYIIDLAGIKLLLLLQCKPYQST